MFSNCAPSSLSQTSILCSSCLPITTVRFVSWSRLINYFIIEPLWSSVLHHLLTEVMNLQPCRQQDSVALMYLKVEQRDINLWFKALWKMMMMRMHSWNELAFSVICTWLLRGESQNRAVWNSRPLSGIFTNPPSNDCHGSFAWGALNKTWCWAI